jgi:hypothetical protein
MKSVEYTVPVVGTSKNLRTPCGVKVKEPDAFPFLFVVRVPRFSMFPGAQPATVWTWYSVLGLRLRTRIFTVAVSVSQLAVPTDSVANEQATPVIAWKVLVPVAAEAVPAVSAKAAAMIVTNDANRFIGLPFP